MILIIFLLFFSAHTSAQSVGINTDGSSPDASAMLDVKSASKGFLPPRIALTGTGDVTTIASPAAGLLIYNTATAGDATPGYYYFDGTGWVKIGKDSQASQWSSNGSSIFYNSGNVGIGTSAPSNRLQVWSQNTITPTSLAVLNNYGGLNGSAGDYEISSLKLGATGASYLGFSTISAKIPSGRYSDAVRLDFSTPNGGNDNTQKVRMSILPFDGNVGIGTVSPSASAALEVSSTSKGFLPPRMSTTQLDSIVVPQEGLEVYNTTNHRKMFFDGTDWVRTDGLHPGDSYAGGIVFYVDVTGMHGLVAAPSDQSLEMPFGCQPGGSGSENGIGMGQANTTKMVQRCAERPIAASICDDLVLNGYDDWFLPSKDELGLMFANLAKYGLGGFEGTYVSSSEYDNSTAWCCGFYEGQFGIIYKSNLLRVRAVRAF